MIIISRKSPGDEEGVFTGVFKKIYSLNDCKARIQLYQHACTVNVHNTSEGSVII
jgi:hypothetical protein